MQPRQQGQTPLIPALSPWLSKTQAEIQAFQQKAPVEAKAQYDSVKMLMEMLQSLFSREMFTLKEENQTNLFIMKHLSGN
jgi:hypothetical protein